MQGLAVVVGVPGGGGGHGRGEGGGRELQVVMGKDQR